MIHGLLHATLVLSVLLSGPDEELQPALARAGERRAAWEEALAACPPELRGDLAFLVEHMSARDLRALDPAQTVAGVALAHEVRARVPWGAALPDEIFRNDVLPRGHVSEARDDMRRELAERFLDRVLDCETPGAAARRLNETIFGELGVRYSTARRRADQSSRETIESGLASCTGLSILLADACRACGVPARLAGIASWPDKRGNHTWVEVWDDGWHFLGAAEPDPAGLDRAWFTGDAARAIPGSREHGIWAVSYARTEHTFPLVWNPGRDDVFAVEVTARYVQPSEVSEPVCRVFVDARGVAGTRLAVPVRVESVDGEPPFAFEGVTRDESADTNDHLTFDVPRGRKVRVAFPDGEAREVVAAGETTLVECAAPLDVSALAARLAEDPADARARLWASFTSSFELAELRANFAAGRVRTADRESPWVAREVGEMPANGWPLVIAMHGGGGVPKSVNDSQWEHMQGFYRDHPEVSGYRYLALRAPNDAWNGFYDDAIAPLVARLILQQVVCAEVDPDRVHAIGYSHGGYGAWVLGPKIPDRFAAVHASAAAPHPGETRLANLFALPFSFMCGERDTAYGRIERCREAAAALAVLRDKSWEGAYPAKPELIDGVGHGGLPDRDKLAEMLPVVRDPLPRRIVWQPSDGRIRNLYWVSIDAPRDGQRLEAELDDNVLRLAAIDVDRATIWLDERLVDLSRPLVVEVGERRTEHGLVPDVAALRESLGRWADPRRLFSVKLVVDFD